MYTCFLVIYLQYGLTLENIARITYFSVLNEMRETLLGYRTLDLYIQIHIGFTAHRNYH